MMQLIDSVIDNVVASINKVARASEIDVRNLGLLAALVLSIAAPLDLSQLTFAFIGALAYAVVHSMQMSTTCPANRHAKDLSRAVSNPTTCLATPPRAALPRRPSQAQAVQLRKNANLTIGTTAISSTITGQDFRTPSKCPVKKPTFLASSWEAEVQELVATLVPSEQSQNIVNSMTMLVKRRLQAIIPEIEVTGFLACDLQRGTAFGVAVPEVDIVANISPDVQVGREGLSCAKKLKKAAIRACTNHLVVSGGFKFRRSAFKSMEPKVTLLAAASLCGSRDSIPLDFSVNSAVPLCNAALVTECGQIEPLARSLILLVRRWAKDRGVCHAAKGHLPPYAWTLMVMYFLQNGTSAALLPPLTGFKCSSHLAQGSGHSAGDCLWVSPNEGEKPTLGQLVKDFMYFYAQEFDFRKEAVSVKSGMRGEPGLELPIHVVLGSKDSSSQVAPSVEDPFEPTRNLSETCTAFTVSRLHDELARAHDLCVRGGSMAELLEPWVPDEMAPEDEE